MTKDELKEDFGCEKCFGATAETFWAGWRNFNEIARLVDDPHDIIRIKACSNCGQRYVAVTTEFIDWEDGEDPIYRSVVPLTLEESERLLSQGEDVDVRLIESLAKTRRYLQTSWPKEEKQESVYWSQGNLHITSGG